MKKGETTKAPPDARDGERVLWVNVILTAIRDATVGFSGEGTPTRERDRRAARAWFRPSNRDFIQVCHLAGMEPCRVAKQATDAIAQYDATIAAGEKFRLPDIAAQKVTIDA